jgi:hypothetical protein
MRTDLMNVGNIVGSGFQLRRWALVVALISDEMEIVPA